MKHGNLKLMEVYPLHEGECKEINKIYIDIAKIQIIAKFFSYSGFNSEIYNGYSSFISEKRPVYLVNEITDIFFLYVKSEPLNNNFIPNCIQAGRDYYINSNIIYEIHNHTNKSYPKLKTKMVCRTTKKADRFGQEISFFEAFSSMPREEIIKLIGGRNNTNKNINRFEILDLT